MLRNHRIMIVCLILAVTLGCGLFSKSTGGSEVILAATEVGTPVGSAATKSIGPSGGSLASPDNRLTLTVPPNAVSDAVNFAIQPVTNKSATGLGLAYGLEPTGKTFTTPLEISVHYDDHDLEGTFPEALSLAYQDQKGAWHLQKSAKLDMEKKTLTVSTTHFSIWSLGPVIKLSPSKATLRVGESLDILITMCAEGFFDRIVTGFADCKTGWWAGTTWRLLGVGKLTGDYPRMIYTAPGKKPIPNVATVVFTYTDIKMVNCPDSITKGDCYKTVYEPLKSEITIVDRGYRASGSDGPTSYSGVVCSLEKPFTITGNNTLVPYPLKFVPSSGTVGTLSYSATYKLLTMAGEGTYTIEGADTNKPRILAQTKSTLSGMSHSSSGGGPAHIDLTPLDTDECK